MPTLILSLGLVALCATLAACSLWAVRVVARKFDALQPPSSPVAFAAPFDDKEIWIAFEGVAKRLDDLVVAVDEGIRNVERSEKRVRGIVQGAQRRFREAGFDDAGVDAEADTLRRDDEERGGEEGLSPVPDDVEPGTYAEPDPWASVPGDF